MKRAFFFVLVFSLAASFSVSKNSGTGPEGLDDLKKQKGLFKTTLINPDTDFSSYNSLYPRRVLLQFRGPGPAEDESNFGSMVRKKSKGPAIPEGEDLETLRKVITDALMGELGSCEVIELADAVGSETLFLRATVTDIVTDIASKSAKAGKDPKPYSLQGNITFDLIDAETGVLLARVGESRKTKKAGDSVAPPDAGAEWVNIWFWAEKAATDFRQELERVLGEERG